MAKNAASSEIQLKFFSLGSSHLSGMIKNFCVKDAGNGESGQIWCAESENEGIFPIRRRFAGNQTADGGFS
jgi:hypothetical protein